jgi:predicted  nucleic acid-binding Zn-ribbon protein
MTKDSVQAEKQTSAPSNQQKTEPKGMFGGKKVEAWASEFRAMESEISALALKIRQTEERLNKPTGLNKDQIDRLPQEIVSLVSQRNNAIKRFNELNDLANKAGVPAEYRK